MVSSEHGTVDFMSTVLLVHLLQQLPTSIGGWVILKFGPLNLCLCDQGLQGLHTVEIIIYGVLMQAAVLTTATVYVVCMGLVFVFFLFQLLFSPLLFLLLQQS